MLFLILILYHLNLIFCGGQGVSIKGQDLVYFKDLPEPESLIELPNSPPSSTYLDALTFFLISFKVYLQPALYTCVKVLCIHCKGYFLERVQAFKQFGTTLKTFRNRLFLGSSTHNSMHNKLLSNKADMVRYLD